MRGALAVAGLSVLFVASSVVGCEGDSGGGGGGAAFDAGSFSPDGGTAGNDGGPGGDGGETLDGDVPDAAPVHYDLHVDPVNGLDTNDGSLAQPFLTLTHLATVATSGQVIGLLDGAFQRGQRRRLVRWPRGHRAGRARASRSSTGVTSCSPAPSRRS